MSRALNLSRAAIGITGDTSGNLGIGVTPSAWEAGWTPLQGGGYSLGSGNAVQMQLGSNWYNNTGYKYRGTGSAALYQQSSGAHSWHYAASGTAGNAITFTQAMTLDASGNLGIGVTSPSVKLQVDGGSTPGTIGQFGNAQGGVILGAASSTAYVNTTSSSPFAFQINGTERARIDTSGNFMVGVTSTSAKFQARGTAAADTLYWLEPYNNAYASKLLISSRSSGDGGIRYGAGGGNDMNVFAYGNLIFNVGSSNIGGTVGDERARIDSSGNFLVGTTTAYGSGGCLVGAFGLAGSISTNPKAVVWGQYSNSAGLPQYCGNWQSTNSWGIGPHSGSNDSIVRIGTISVSGSGAAWTGSYANVYAGAYTNASDYRIKENVADVSDGVLAKVMALRPVTYNLIHVPDEDGDTPPVKDEVGFIAHEIQEQFPVLVLGEKDAVDGNGSPQHQGVDYAKLSAYLVKAMQEQQTIIEALTTRVTALEGA